MITFDFEWRRWLPEGVIRFNSTPPLSSAMIRYHFLSRIVHGRRTGESSSSMDLLGKRIMFISSGWLSWPTGSGNVSIMLRKWVIGSTRTRRTVISVPTGFDLIQFPSLPSATHFSSFLKTQTLTLVLRPICDCGWANCRLCCRVWSLFMSSPTAESVIHCNCTIYHGIMETTIRWLQLQMPYMAFGNGMEWMVVNAQ